MLNVAYLKQANLKDWFIRTFCLKGSFQWAIKEMQAGRAVIRKYPGEVHEYRLVLAAGGSVEMKCYFKDGPKEGTFSRESIFYESDFTATDWTSKDHE